MGSAYQCDRCASFDEGIPALRVTTKTTTIPVQERSVELCPACLMELADWLGAHTEKEPT
jgi:hypothetical protein